MIIKRLTLHNFGVYASTNIFDFNAKKPIVLIGGLNGRGKTTFLEAVLIALYGSNSFAFRESRYNSYGQYIRSYVNRDDNTLETYIELEIELNNSAHDVYTVKRMWDAKNKVRSTESISVKKNGVDDEFLTNNWSMFIENILPSALSNFFFFDGEKIAELAVDNTDSKLKESIRAMLGISIIDSLKADIRRSAGRVKKKNAESQEEIELEKLKAEKKDAEESLTAKEAEINYKKVRLAEIEKEIDEKKAEYATHGGDIVDQRDVLEKEKSILTETVDNNRESMMLIASGALPLTLVKDLLDNIEKKGKIERKNRIKEQARNYIEDLYNKYREKNSNTARVDDFVKYVKDESEVDGTDAVYNLSDSGLYQLINLNKTGLCSTVEKTSDIIKKQNDIDARLDEIENYLSVDINEDELRNIDKSIQGLEKSMVKIETELEMLENDRRSANGTLMRVTSEYNKKVADILEKMETDDDNQRVIKYSEMAINVLDDFEINIQRAKTGMLADTITACYKKLANKKNLIDRIEMNPDTLELTYINKAGDEVKKTALSAGEKQLMVISILWALAKCSKKKLPVIIDTPLSRLDSNHRKALIQIYFPQASDQTIILSTDSEIDRHYYELMKENVGDEFTLEYNDETRSTSIRKGYFIGAL